MAAIKSFYSHNFCVSRLNRTKTCMRIVVNALQRISLEIQRGNAASVLGSFTNSEELEEKIMSSMPKDVTKFTKEEFAAFVNSFDTVLSDCDGVLWLDNEVIQDSENVLNKFQQIGKKVFYVTNNSTKTREEFLTKCHKLNFIAKPDDIVSTAYLAAEYLHNLGFKKKVYVIGSQGVVKELDRFGIKHTDIGPDSIEPSLPLYIENKLRLDGEIGAVVAGFDEHFSYPKMLKAASYLNNPDCLFIGTNTDERVPVRKDLVIPGTGSIIRCLETLSERKAFVVGKPNDYIKNAVIDKYGTDPKRTLMIGDRCNTDILFGRRCGFQTLLVLTGVTSLEEVSKWTNSGEPELEELVPQYYAPKLGDLLSQIQ